MKKTTDLCDQFESEIQVADPVFISYGKRTQFSGPIRTISVFEDNVLVKKALEEASPGIVLVVDGGGSTSKRALLGDNVAMIAKQNNVAGIVINGYVRDSADLAEIEIGIMALGTLPIRSRKVGKGTTGHPLNFAGIQFEPGHYLYADEDGIVVLDREV